MISRKQFYGQNLHPTKSKMAAILKFTLVALTRPILHVFARNFFQGLKMTSQKQISDKLYLVQIQDGDVRHFEIHYNDLNSVSVAPISGKFD